MVSRVENGLLPFCNTVLKKEHFFPTSGTACSCSGVLLYLFFWSGEDGGGWQGDVCVAESVYINKNPKH